MLTRAEAHKIALSVPGTYEKPYFNKPSIFHGEDFVALVHDKHPAVVLRVSSIEMRDMMLKAEPQLFTITDHYKNWPALLVRLESLDGKTLKDLIRGRIAQLDAMAGKSKKKPRPKNKIAKKVKR